MAWEGFWPVADGHADTLAVLAEQHRVFTEESAVGHLDLPRLRRAGLDLQVLAVCAGGKPSAGAWARKIVAEFSMIAAVSGIVWLRNEKDWRRWESGRNIGVVLALEGLEPLEGDPDVIEEFYRLGVRMASLTWNHANGFAGGVLGSGGLTAKGRRIVAAMGEMGIALDLSHLNAESFWQVVREDPKCPILATHSNAAALCAHPRNLTDEQIRAIADRGGTVGVALHQPFLGRSGANAVRAADHILHILETGGADCPALGCDFDGIPHAPPDLADVSALPALFKVLRARVKDGRALAGVFRPEFNPCPAPDRFLLICQLSQSRTERPTFAWRVCPGRVEFFSHYPGRVRFASPYPAGALIGLYVYETNHPINASKRNTSSQNYIYSRGGCHGERQGRTHQTPSREGFGGLGPVEQRSGSGTVYGRTPA